MHARTLHGMVILTASNGHTYSIVRPQPTPSHARASSFIVSRPASHDTHPQRARAGLTHRRIDRCTLASLSHTQPASQPCSVRVVASRRSAAESANDGVQAPERTHGRPRGNGQHDTASILAGAHITYKHTNTSSTTVPHPSTTRSTSAPSANAYHVAVSSACGISPQSFGLSGVLS